MKVQSSKNQFDIQDPTNQYPRPEFPAQTQAVPGLAREMDPRPDHGEESYHGLGRLKGRKALVTGADSGIGRAAAIAFAREGADVTLCKAALTYMPAGASIINTASIQSYSPSPNLLDYASTKAAIVAFTKALAKQVAGKGIRVNAVAPGPIWTPLQTSGGQPPEKIPAFGGHTPLGRAGQPAELASVYVFLASQESSYVTGEVYGVTGGNPTP